MIEELKQTNEKLVSILSQEKGYFGRVYTWGMRPTRYENVGYVLTEDFYSTLEKMTEIQRKTLRKVMSYFEIHADPLKHMLDIQDKEPLEDFFATTAWSHFMILVMFGMLEVVAISSPCVIYGKGKKPFPLKEISIQAFLDKYLSEDIKSDISKKYQQRDGAVSRSFSEVIKHLWGEIRSGFVHEAGIDSTGLEWTTFGGGVGTEDDPIKIRQDVPVQEFIRMAWQAILNSYGYTGSLESPKYVK